jgi:hypothetical protein
VYLFGGSGEQGSGKPHLQAAGSGDTQEGAILGLGSMGLGDRSAVGRRERGVERAGFLARVKWCVQREMENPDWAGGSGNSLCANRKANVCMCHVSSEPPPRSDS